MPNHSQFGNTLNSLGAFLLMQEQTDEAERLLERALPITERAGKDASIYADTIAGLGMVISRETTGQRRTLP